MFWGLKIVAKFPALPLFTDAYLADTRHLSTLQHGAYLLLLMMAWRMPDCALPDDDEKLARWAGIDRRTWNANKATILAFWRLGDDGMWRQWRLSDERRFVQLQSSIASKNSKKRWDRDGEDDGQQRCKNVKQLASKNADSSPSILLIEKETGQAAALPKVCQIDAPTPTPTNPYNPLPEKQQSQPDELLSADPEVLMQFEAFWHPFPKKGTKAKTKAEWVRACKREPGGHKRILQGFKAFMAYVAAGHQENKFVKNSENWLADDQWLNDYTIPSGSKKRDRRFAEQF